MSPIARIRHGRIRAAAVPLLLLATLALPGCATVPYYSQAVSGEIGLMSASRPVADWLADPATPAGLKERLALAARMRAFASQQLSLPDNRSYTRYADLHRSSAVWNVFAASPYSLTLHTWCYPLFGCAGYRGYFDRSQADAYARSLAGDGLDVYVAPVPAFSTLGWLNDPLLNTFISWPEPELARLIFHELAHQVVYVSDDTRFNEGFATAVERAGVARWIAYRKDAALQEEFRLRQQRHADFLQLVAATRHELESLYADPAGKEPRAQKQAIFEELQARYRHLRDERWGGYAGYDGFFREPWNNARVAALAAYEDAVPAFDALLAREDGDLPRFFAQVRKLAALAPAQRDEAMRALAAAVRTARASTP
jgi:predicted aminopeptidase